MKRVGVLKSGRRLGLPRLQVFERGFEIASLGLSNGPKDSRRPMASRRRSVTSLIADS